MRNVDTLIGCVLLIMGTVGAILATLDQLEYMRYCRQLQKREAVTEKPAALPTAIVHKRK